MHPESNASGSPATASPGSMRHDTEQLAAYAEKSLRDRRFFALLDPVEQILVLDTLIATKSHLAPDHRNAFLSCCLALLNSATGECFAAAPEKAVHVIRSLVHNDLMSMPKMKALILPLRCCMERVLANIHAITALHSVFLQLCVALDMFDVALPFLSIPTYDIDSTLVPTSLEYLSFQYFSGMVFAAFKRFDKALASFDLAIGAVSVQISAVQIAAYKKRVLIDIILNGSDTTPLPKLISPVVMKNLEALSAPYHQFEAAAAAGRQVLESLFQECHVQLQQDGHIGLAKQALSSLQKAQIAKLAGSYTTLSLLDIAKTVGIEDVVSVEGIVLSMIEEGSINASIDQARQMLTFYEDTQSFTNEESLSRLFEQLKEISAAHDRVLARNIALAVDQQFLKKSLEGNARSEAGALPSSELHATDMQQLFG